MNTGRRTTANAASNRRRGRRTLGLALGLALGSALGVGALGACGPEAKAPEAKAPEAKAPEVKAPEAKAPEAKAPADPSAPPVKTRVKGAPRIVAFGDVHGDLQATLAALRLAGAIAADGETWIGGSLVLVQTGDQLDRGDDERAILELFDRLADEAAAAGGAFYILNGNHELMNAAGDLRYVTPGGFADFARVPDLPLNDPKFASVPEVVRPRFAAFAPGGPYARMLAKRPTVLVVGDTVFAHGGVLPEHVSYGLEKINQEIQRWLLGQTDTPPAIASGETSPVWTRDYSMEPDASDCATLDRALAAIPAKRMVVGHTVQIEGVKSACGGKVWLVDVGMAKHYGGSPSVIEIVGDTVNVLR